MAAASGDRPIQNVLGNPNDFNDLYRHPSVKVVFFTIASAKISNTGAILILRIGSAASIPIASHERNLERYKIISRVPPSCTTKQRIRRRLSSQRPPSVVIMAAKNKCLAQMNKSGTAGKATKKASNPASRVDPMGADHRVVPAIKQALSMLPQPWSQRAMLTSNDYKELAARCTELASESSEPTVAEALRALASDYLARAAKLHFVFLEPRHEAARHEHCRR